MPVGILGGAKGVGVAYSGTRTILQRQLSKLSPNLRNKIIGKELDKLVKNGIDDKAWVEYVSKQIRQLPPTELRILIQELSPETAAKPHVQEAFDHVEQQVNDKLDMPFENTPDGTLEHIRRMNGAMDALNNNEQPRILPSTEEVKIDLDPNKPVARYERLDPNEIIADAKVFQFKTDGDVEGVSNKLKGITKWDQDASNVVMVWQNEKGQYFIADGHQRLGLAKRIIKNDPSQEVYLNAAVRREIDGWSANETMVEAMVQNLQMGTATASDLARGIRVSPDFIKLVQNRVAPNSSLWNYASGLYKLSDDAWGYFLNAKIPEMHGAIVGKEVADTALHLSILKILEKTKPKSATETRIQIAAALDAGSRNVETIDMFGTQTIKESLIVERSKVFKAAMAKIKNDKRVMATLVENETQIQAAGKNKLDTQYNRTQEEKNATAIYQIETLATRKGEISDALNQSAKLWADGNKQEAVKTFIESVRRAIDDGSHKRISASGDERTRVFENSTLEVSKKPEESIRQKNLDDFDDPNNIGKANKVANQEVAEVSDAIRMASNSPESIRGGAPVISDTVKRADASFQLDEGLLQSTGTAPPSEVLANATAPAPFALIDDTISIGSFNDIVKKPVVQGYNNVDQLIGLANKYKPTLKTTLNNIVKSVDNASVEVRVKKINETKNKIALAKEQKGESFDGSYIGDYLGGRITVKSLEDVKKVFNQLEAQGFKTIAFDNYFINPKDTGYRAIHLNLVTKDGFSMEVQIQHQDLSRAFKNGKAFRGFKNRELTEAETIEYQRLAAEDKVLFDETYNQIKQREGFIDDADYVLNNGMTKREFDADVKNDNDIIGQLLMRDCV